jgi:hypothetical protein
LVSPKIGSRKLQKRLQNHSHLKRKVGKEHRVISYQILSQLWKKSSGLGGAMPRITKFARTGSVRFKDGSGGPENGPQYP